MDVNFFIEGIFALIWVSIALIIGIRITYKAVVLKRKELIAVGMTYICLSSAWWGVVIQFISYGFFSSRISDQFYLCISHIFLPVGLFCWIYAFVEIVIPFQKKEGLIVTMIYVILWEVVLVFLLFTNLELVGKINPINILDSSHGPVEGVFVFITLIVFLLTGIYFSIKSMKLDDLELKWKGRFLLIGWICLTIGALIDALLKNLSPLLIIITRLILISSAILYYLGFFLPAKLRELLIK